MSIGNAPIASLEMRGDDTREAEHLLAVFQELLAVYVGIRDKVRRQLGLNTPASS